jgi:hypothetical protein
VLVQVGKQRMGKRECDHEWGTGTLKSAGWLRERLKSIAKEGTVFHKMRRGVASRELHRFALWFWPNRPRKRILRWVVALGILTGGTAIADIYLPNLFPFLDLTGFSATNSTTGSVDLSGPFFQSLGTNGRSCGTCHAPSDGFGLSAVDAQFRYFSSHGKDPLFDQVDGSTCPTGPINNNLVVNNGLIRIGLQIAPNSFDASPAQYTITAVQDPYGCALTTNPQGQQTASVYRRPLPATNLGFLSASCGTAVNLSSTH